MSVVDRKLGRWAARKNLNKLHRALKAKDPKTRVGALMYMAILKDASSIPHLEKMTLEKEEEVLRHAAYALETIDPSNPKVDRLRENASRVRQKKAREEGRGFKSFIPPKPPNTDESDPNYESLKAYQMYVEKVKKREQVASLVLRLFIGFGLLVIGALIVMRVLD